MLVGTSMFASEKESGNISNNGKGCNIDIEKNLYPLHPTYLTNITETSTWGSNWFLELKGGASAFLGSPIGCGDVFDRTKPVLQVGLGKWFTPSVGGRVSFQGLQFKNANLQTMDYQYYHADFIYNLTHNLQQDENGLSKLDVIPFIGAGIIRNGSVSSDYFTSGGQSCGNHPFALAYGVEVRYQLRDRWHLVGEISGMTTLKNFDCVGTSCSLGDNMLNLSVGLSYTIGKKGWKKVVDALPYMRQNDYLLRLHRGWQRDSTISSDENSARGKNDYGGLNSLRCRLSKESTSAALGEGNTTTEIGIGVPVYFYFKLNSVKLVDKSQLVNLDEIAKIAKGQKDLVIHISGAADCITGTTDVNRRLSKERAKYIGKLLIRKGVEKERLKAVSLGGINQFVPKEANRFTMVMLAR